MIDIRRDFNFFNVLLLNFVNLNIEEKKLVRNWRNNECISKWMYSDHIISLKDHIEFIKRLKKDNHNFYWLVKNKSSVPNRGYIGVIYLNRVDFKNRNAFLGVYSNPKLKKTGEILITAIKRLSFEKTELHSLKLEVISSNNKAINFYKKHGFKEEGMLKEFIVKGNEWKDVVIMGLVNENYG